MPKIDNFNELMERAKAAQQVLRDLELERLGAGDPSQLAKLDSAIESFSSLADDAGFAPVEQPRQAPPAQAKTAAPAAASKAATPMVEPVVQPRREDATPLGTVPGAPANAVTRPQLKPVAPPPPPAKPKPKVVVTPSTAPTSFDEQLSKGLYTRRLRRVFVTGRGQGMVPIANLPHRDGLPAFDNCLAPDDSPVDGAYGVFVAPQSVFTAILRHPMESRRWQVIETIHCTKQKEVVDAVAHLLRRPTINLEIPDES